MTLAGLFSLKLDRQLAARREIASKLVKRGMAARRGRV
jgi:hypothetical protein